MLFSIAYYEECHLFHNLPMFSHQAVATRLQKTVARYHPSPDFPSKILDIHKKSMSGWLAENIFLPGYGYSIELTLAHDGCALWPLCCIAGGGRMEDDEDGSFR